MAVVFTDGCTHYQTADMLYKWYSSSGTIVATNPRRSGSKSIYGNYGIVTKQLPAIGANTHVGCAMRLNSYNYSYIGFSTAGGNFNLSVAFNSDMSISVRRGTYYGGTILQTSPINVYRYNEWFYLEFGGFIDASAGTYDARINGTSIISNYVGVNTYGSGTAANLYVTFSAYSQMTDFYIDDAAFHGDCFVATLPIVGAGTYAQFTATGDTDNWKCADDPGAIDNDTTYNASNTVNQIDTFALQDIPSIAGSAIHAVALNATWRKDDPGTRKVTPLYRMNGVNYLGTEVNMFDNYHQTQEIYETRPDGGGAWVEADLKYPAFEPGYKLTV